METITKIFEILKFPIKFIVVIVFVFGLLLFLPHWTLEKLKLVEFINTYGKFIGILFLVSGSYLVLLFAAWIQSYFHKQKRLKKFISELEKDLIELSPNEIYLLREFYIQGNDTIQVPIDNPVVAGLLHKKIIYIISNTGRASIFGMFLSVRINNLLKNKITTDLLRLPNGQPTEQEIEDIKSKRPDYL